MLTEIYIEALLVNGKLADHIWEAWQYGKIAMWLRAQLG